jgi:hypothetical protein
VQEAGWAPEPVWTQRQGEKIFVQAETNITSEERLKIVKGIIGYILG